MRAIAYQPLDNGLLSCADPVAAQAICDGLSAEKIEGLLRKWLALLPHPFSAKDRRAGYRYQISILQAEFSLTQVLSQPLMGRVFFEDVIRENLSLGRPDQVQLIFERRVVKRTSGRFRTRVITDGVIPSLHVDYKHSRIKQYFKEGRALRTETVINDTRDFDIGKRLCNLPLLRKIGFTANRRLLDVQTVSHDCALGEEAFRRLQQPMRTKGQRVSSLRFGDPRSHAVLAALPLFHLQARSFNANDLRQHLAPLLGLLPQAIEQGRLSYELRRLRHRGLIARVPKHHRYIVTPFGLKVALFTTLAYDRLFRRGLATIVPTDPPNDSKLRTTFDRLLATIDLHCRGLAA
jgi:hypothetical protein